MQLILFSRYNVCDCPPPPQLVCGPPLQNIHGGEFPPKTDEPVEALRATGALKLKTIHEHYYQVMGQLGLTGTDWCDFYVQAESDYHCERIVADPEAFSEMKMKLEKFYFTYYLPELAKQKQEAS